LFSSIKLLFGVNSICQLPIFFISSQSSQLNKISREEFLKYYVGNEINPKFESFLRENLTWKAFFKINLSSKEFWRIIC